MKGDLKFMKKSKVLSLLIASILVFSSFTVAFADTSYSPWNSMDSYPKDVINTEYFSSVKTLIDKKIITGYEDGTFKPEKPITRAEIAVAITKMTGRVSQVEAAKTVNKFADLSSKNYDWARGSVNVLSDAGIIKGTSDTTFSPGKNITYSELMTFLIRTRAGAVSEIEGYGTWPNNYIEYAQRYNLTGNITIKDWNAQATRGDMAKLMYRMMPKNN